MDLSGTAAHALCGAGGVFWSLGVPSALAQGLEHSPALQAQ